MAKHDVVVIGAGAAGLSAGAILAKEGKTVLVLDRDKYLGGRGMAIPFEGYYLNLGGHLLEDSGSGITKIISYIGGNLEHGPVSRGMPIWVGNRWKPVQELYKTDKTELKKVIHILCDIDWKELNQYDDVPLRTWLRKYTSNEGVIALFEYIAAAEAMTEHWYDHVASDNLYVRKMHYMEKRSAGYSFWPTGGWHGMFQQLADGLKRHGGELWLEATAQRLLVEKGRVVGIAYEKGPKAIPNEAYNWEVIETDCVISTLPVWNVLQFVQEQDLPDWYVAQIKLLAQDQFRACWLGIYAATREPVYTGIDPTELAVWFGAPHSKLGGFAFLATGYDPGVAPPGVHLFNCGFVFQGLRSSQWYEKHFNLIEEDLKVFYPNTWTKKNILWKKRHLVAYPAFGVIQKPCMVGKYRPDYRAPNIDGLFFASETFRSRGIGVDRAARAGLTCAELALGRRLPHFKDSWHD